LFGISEPLTVRLLLHPSLRDVLRVAKSPSKIIPTDPWNIPQVHTKIKLQKDLHKQVVAGLGYCSIGMLDFSKIGTFVVF